MACGRQGVWWGGERIIGRRQDDGEKEKMMGEEKRLAPKREARFDDKVEKLLMVRYASWYQLCDGDQGSRKHPENGGFVGPR